MIINNFGLLNSRGQFFSPDLIVAVGVFVFALIVFFGASTSVFSQSAVFDSQKGADETAHAVLNSLLLSPGSPANWENTPMGDINSIGFVYSNNEISPAKAVRLANGLSDSQTYYVYRSLLGSGKYDFYFRLVGSSGEVLSFEGTKLQGGVVLGDARTKVTFTRAVIYGGAPAVLEATFSIGK